MHMADWISGQGSGTQSQHGILTMTCVALDIGRMHASSPDSTAPTGSPSPALPLHQASISPAICAAWRQSERVTVAVRSPACQRLLSL